MGWFDKNIQVPKFPIKVIGKIDFYGNPVTLLLQRILDDWLSGSDYWYLQVTLVSNLSVHFVQIQYFVNILITILGILSLLWESLPIPTKREFALVALGLLRFHDGSKMVSANGFARVIEVSSVFCDVSIRGL